MAVGGAAEVRARLVGSAVVALAPEPASWVPPSPESPPPNSSTPAVTTARTSSAANTIRRRQYTP